MGYNSYPNKAWNNRVISLAEHEQILLPFGRTGLIGYSATLPVYAGAAARTLMLRANTRGAVRGTRFNITSEHTIGPDMILANTSGAPRRDLLVMRLNREAADPNQFTIAPLVLTGVAAAVPVAPTPVRNDTADGTGFWDFPITEIPVPNGAGVLSIAASDFRGWWTSPTGYTGLDAAKPPPEPGLIFRANDSGVSYIASHTGNWERIYSNSGLVNVPVTQTGWNTTRFAVARVGNLVTMTLALQRTGAEIPSTTSATIGNIPDKFRPIDDWYGTYHCSRPDHSSHVVVNANGSFTLVGTNTTAMPIQQSASIFSNMQWLAA